MTTKMQEISRQQYVTCNLMFGKRFCFSSCQDAFNTPHPARKSHHKDLSVAVHPHPTPSSLLSFQQPATKQVRAHWMDLQVPMEVGPTQHPRNKKNWSSPPTFLDTEDEACPSSQVQMSDASWCGHKGDMGWEKLSHSLAYAVSGPGPPAKVIVLSFHLKWEGRCQSKKSPNDPEIPHLDIYPKNWNTLYTHTHCSEHAPQLEGGNNPSFYQQMSW